MMQVDPPAATSIYNSKSSYGAPCALTQRPAGGGGNEDARVFKNRVRICMPKFEILYAILRQNDCGAAEGKSKI